MDFQTWLLLFILFSFVVVGVDYLDQYYFMDKRKNKEGLSQKTVVLFGAFFGIMSLWAFFFGTDFIVAHVQDEGTHGDTFGGTVGPVVAWLAAIITFAAFWVQYQANQQQKEDIKIERFENRFFKFIDYHRENVNSLKYRDPKSKDKYWEGNQVFTIIYYEIVDLLEEYFKARAFKSMHKGLHYDLKKISVREKAKAIDFVYHCVFYGAGKHSLRIFEDDFANDFQYVNFKERKANYLLEGKRPIYYSGHVRRLGHYFRNIFQAVKYVEQQGYLSEKQKYDYITVLRAQMSVYEQAVFFYNSLSGLGDVWEWGHYQKSYPENNKERENVFKKLLVTKYDFVRNSLNNRGEISEGISIKAFYPLLNLEREAEVEQIGLLPFVDSNRFLCRYCFNKKYIKYEDEHAEIAIVEALGSRNCSLNCIEKDNCETNKVLERSRNNIVRPA